MRLSNRLSKMQFALRGGQFCSGVAHYNVIIVNQVHNNLLCVCLTADRDNNIAMTLLPVLIMAIFHILNTPSWKRVASARACGTRASDAYSCRGIHGCTRYMRI